MSTLSHVTFWKSLIDVCNNLIMFCYINARKPSLTTVSKLYFKIIRKKITYFIWCDKGTTKIFLRHWKGQVTWFDFKTKKNSNPTPNSEISAKLSVQIWFHWNFLVMVKIIDTQITVHQKSSDGLFPFTFLHPF